MSLLLGAELQENVTVVLFWIYYLFIPIFFLEIASLSGVLRQCFFFLLLTTFLPYQLLFSWKHFYELPTILSEEEEAQIQKEI